MDTQSPSSAFSISDPNLAATLIQAMYKGYKTRKDLSENGKAPNFQSHGSSEDVTAKRNSLLNSPSSVHEAAGIITKSQAEPLESFDRDTIEQAATKIQSFVKGYLTRKDVKDFLATLPLGDHRFDKLKKELFTSDNHHHDKEDHENLDENSSSVTDNLAHLKTTGEEDDTKALDKGKGADNLPVHSSTPSGKGGDQAGGGGDYYASTYSASSTIKTEDDPLDTLDAKGVGDYYKETRTSTNVVKPHEGTVEGHHNKETPIHHLNKEIHDYLDSATTAIQSTIKSFIHGKKNDETSGLTLGKHDSDNAEGIQTTSTSETHDVKLIDDS